MARRGKTLTYGEHLQLDKLLACQIRQSEKHKNPAHDEMLFIIVHQAYELWFKQILFELDRIEEIFAGRCGRRPQAGYRRSRSWAGSSKIQRLLIQQLDVLETMTPLDFLDFRDYLFPASGFQSLQFRLLETRLGLRRADRLEFEARPFDTRLRQRRPSRSWIAAEQRPSLFALVEGWLSAHALHRPAELRLQRQSFGRPWPTC